MIPTPIPGCCTATGTCGADLGAPLGCNDLSAATGVPAVACGPDAGPPPQPDSGSDATPPSTDSGTDGGGTDGGGTDGGGSDTGGGNDGNSDATADVAEDRAG